MTKRVFHALVVAVMVVTLVYPSLSSGKRLSWVGCPQYMMTDPNKDPKPCSIRSRSCKRKSQNCGRRCNRQIR